MPKFDFTTWGPATVLLVLMVLVVAVGGLVLVAVHPDTLNFETYLNDLEKFAIALGILSVGRGVHLGLAAHGRAQSPSYNADLSDRGGAEDHPNS